MKIDLEPIFSSTLLSWVLGAAFMLLFMMLWSRRRELDCTDLICAPDKEGKKRLSLTRIGQCMGVIVAVWAPVVTTLEGKLEGEVLAISLAYLGAIEGYSKYLRWKSDHARNGGGHHGAKT